MMFLVFCNSETPTVYFLLIKILTLGTVLGHNFGLFVDTGLSLTPSGAGGLCTGPPHCGAARPRSAAPPGGVLPAGRPLLSPALSLEFLLHCGGPSTFASSGRPTTLVSRNKLRIYRLDNSKVKC